MTLDDELLEVFRSEMAEELARLRRGVAADPSGWDVGGLFRSAHSVKGAARLVGVPELEAHAHALEEVLSVARLEGVSDAMVPTLRAGVASLAGALSRAPQLALGATTSPSSALTAPPGSPAAELSGPNLSEVRAIAQAAPPMAPGPSKVGTVRVAVDRLEHLADVVQSLLAENNALRARETALSELAGFIRESTAGSSAAVMSRLTALETDLSEQVWRQDGLARTLRVAVYDLKMVDLSALGGLARKVAEDASRVSGRSVRFETAGVHTRLDRRLIDALRDPLVHLVRNAVAHGLEGPEERVAAGKSPVGSIALSAVVVGDRVELCVSDDGRGFDREALVERAVALGALSAEAGLALSASERLELAFLPGLTTQVEADAIAGRGVGLDVVKATVEHAGGRVTLSSQVGTGTQVMVSLPLTQLTTVGLLVEVGGTLVVLPALYVRHVDAFVSRNVLVAEGRSWLRLQEARVPLVDLGGLLGAGGTLEARTVCITVDTGDGAYGLLVDAVHEQADFTLHALPWNLVGLPGVASLVWRPSGAVAWVVDPRQLAGAEQRSTVSFPTAAPARPAARLLVTDDSITSRTLISRLLKAAGYSVVTAVDGEDAWRVLQAASFDLLISDVEMPLLDGLALARRVRADERLTNLPLILVTSLDSPEERARGAECGASAYVVKGDFDQDALLRAVERLL